MDKNEVLKILETARDENGEVPMRLVRQAFENLSAAQPEIIYCKDCKWWAVIPNEDIKLSDYRACYAFRHCQTKAIDFCSRAERKVDESN